MYQTHESSTLQEAMHQSVSYWEYLTTPSMIAIPVFSVIILIILIKLILRDITWSHSLGVGVGAGIFYTIIIFWFSITPTEVADHKEEKVIEHIEANYDVHNVHLTEITDNENIYQATVTFQQLDSPYSYETKMKYNDEYGIMVPVLATEYDDIPVKEESEVATILAEEDGTPTDE